MTDRLYPVFTHTGHLVGSAPCSRNARPVDSFDNHGRKNGEEIRLSPNQIAEHLPGFRLLKETPPVVGADRLPFPVHDTITKLRAQGLHHVADAMVRTKTVSDELAQLLKRQPLKMSAATALTALVQVLTGDPRATLTLTHPTSTYEPEPGLTAEAPLPYTDITITAHDRVITKRISLLELDRTHSSERVLVANIVEAAKALG